MHAQHANVLQYKESKIHFEIYYLYRKNFFIKSRYNLSRSIKYYLTLFYHLSFSLVILVSSCLVIFLIVFKKNLIFRTEQESLSHSYLFIFVFFFSPSFVCLISIVLFSYIKTLFKNLMFRNNKSLINLIIIFVRNSVATFRFAVFISLLHERFTGTESADPMQHVDQRRHSGLSVSHQCSAAALSH